MSDSDGTSPNHRRNRMKLLIDRLIDEAPKMEGAPVEDAGAIEAQIILRSGYQAVGALGKDMSGLLKFMVIGKPRGGDGVIAAEHFFDYDDLEAVVVLRAMVAPDDKPRIYTGQG